jgi:hypothetical protein
MITQPTVKAIYLRKNAEFTYTGEVIIKYSIWYTNPDKNILKCIAVCETMEDATKVYETAVAQEIEPMDEIIQLQPLN